jgi:hypothetical protein
MGLPRSSFAGRSERRLAAALIGLQFTVRSGREGRRLARALTRAQRAAKRLPDGAEADWYRSSLSSLRE